jgi:hypothetical protein
VHFFEAGVEHARSLPLFAGTLLYSVHHIADLYFVSRLRDAAIVGQNFAAVSPIHVRRLWPAERPNRVRTTSQRVGLGDNGLDCEKRGRLSQVGDNLSGR